MDIKDIKQIFIDLLTQLLENKIDRKTAAKLMREYITWNDVFNFKDNCVSYVYCIINGLDYEYCTTTDSELLYFKECLEEKRKYSNEDRWEFLLNSKEAICKLIPSLKGQKLDLNDFYRYTPEKFEYFNGYVFGDKIVASQLLVLLMTNVGIETVIKLAPKEVWEEALKEL